MNKKQITEFKELGVDATSGAVGAVAGAVLLGPVGAIVGSLITTGASYVLKRDLAKRERKRVEIVYDLALKKIKEKIDQGAGIRKDLDKEKLKELTEGTLLRAKDSYEEKKLPLIANLLAAAPFTSTPPENLNQSLIYAEQLSYRQLCILEIVYMNEWGEVKDLTDDPLFKKNGLAQLDEAVEGVYSDINHLLVLGLIGQELSPGAGPAISSGMFMISPARLRLLYPGRLLVNGLLLDQIEKDEIEAIVDVLRQ